MEEKFEDEGPVEIPQTLTESVPLQRRLHALVRQIRRVSDRREKRIAAIRKDAADSLAELDHEAKRIADALFAYASGHRRELTEDDARKTVTTEGGVMQWYKGSAAVVLTRPEEELIALFEKREAFKGLVRVEKSLDLEAILASIDLIRQKKVGGITTESSEFFALKPRGEGGQVVCDTAKPDSWEVRLPKRKLKKG